MTSLLLDINGAVFTVVGPAYQCACHLHLNCKQTSGSCCLGPVSSRGRSGVQFVWPVVVSSEGFTGTNVGVFLAGQKRIVSWLKRFAASHPSELRTGLHFDDPSSRTQ